MISPDAANLGLKAIYIWAGLLVPTTVLLYLYYPEVSSEYTERPTLTLRPTVDHTKSLTSSMSERYLPGDSKTPRPSQTNPATRIVLSNITVIDREMKMLSSVHLTFVVVLPMFGSHCRNEVLYVCLV